MSVKVSHPFSGETKGLIYLVATPIGNIQDVSARAEEILSSADIIACEDTRVTSSLLGKLNIKPKKLVSCFSQKEKEEGAKLVKLVKEQGLTLAFVSDAGTPGISDPGALLAAEAIEQGVEVSSVPGPTAFTSALVVSGFDTADFSFYGFLPSKPSARACLLNELVHRKETLIFYEAGHRLQETLKALLLAFGSDRRICLAREITKIHEEYTRGTLGEISQAELTLLGEFVLVVEGSKDDKKEMSEKEILDEAADMLKQGMKKTEVAKVIAADLKINKNTIYTLIKDL